MAARTVPFVIDGEPFYPDKRFDIRSPTTGQVLHQCGGASPEEALRAVDAAAEALGTWRETPPQERRDLFLRAADIMNQRRDELMQYHRDETGTDADWAAFNIDTSVSIIRDVAGRISSLSGTFPATEDPKRSAVVLREPYGVVLSIAPWNAPYILGTRSVAFPLAAGNTVVFKVSELAPRTMCAIADVFQQAGLPKGVLNTIAHDPSDAAPVTAALIASPKVKKINFTGSTNVGRILAKQAGQYLKPVVLELGGKAPAIVWKDANLDLAAEQCALGSFLNTGQICMSTERILVHKDVAGAFREKLAAAITDLFPASGEAPVVINGAAAAKNHQLRRNALGLHASSLVGNVDAVEKVETHMRPLVLNNVTPDMEIYQTESFGPTVAVMEIEDESEAIRIANDTEYGLSSAVFTEDLRLGLRFAREIETGAVHINAMTVHDESALPHGGCKNSGYGRFGTSIGLEEWTRTKTITFNK